MRPQQRFKSDYHEVSTEEVNRIVLSSNDDKRLQTFDGITTYPYSTNAFKVRESEMLIKLKNLKVSGSEMLIKSENIPIKMHYNKK